MKRPFSRGWLAALTLALFVSTGLGAAPEYRAFWIDAFHAGFLNQSQVDTLLGVPGTAQGGRIRDANCNMVIVQVRKRFDVCYPSGVGEPYMSGLSPANFNGLAALIKAAHDTTGGKQRVEVHCWSVAFKTGKGAVYSQHIDPPTGSLTTFDNYWPTRISSTDGAETGDGAFDPGHPKVLEYLVNTHMDLVNFQTTAGPDGTDGHIDGIHYDYIRFEGSSEGFNPTSVARYNARYGLAGDPSAGSEQFKQWRRDQVSAFVRQMYARIQKTKPWVKQSGSFVTWNPSPTSSTRSAFQATRPYYDVYSDWDSWLQEGTIDIAVPMTYYNWASLPNDYVRWMNFQKDRKANRHVIVGPGVYLNLLDDAILELQMTRDATPSGNYGQGFSGYSYYAPYTLGGTSYGSWPNFAPRLVSDVTPTKADIPSMPWKTTPSVGHLMGTVTFAHNGRWADHVVVSISGPVNRNMYVDGTGFYAFIDLPPGAYSINATLAGYAPYMTNVTITAGGAATRDMAMQLNGPPGITAHPQSKTVYAGAPVSFAANAAGTEPLKFQWRHNGQPISTATATSYSITAVSTNDAGSYDFVVTNLYGKATSQVATLTVIVPQATERFTPLWSLAPGTRTYLTSNADQRGMAYNPVSGRLLIVNKAVPNVHVLDPQTGDDLHTLNKTGVSGGYTSAFYLLSIGVAEDGAVYACNLALNAASTAFKLYKWANDASDTEPILVYSGDPLPGNIQRWGDTIDVRGSGANTQIIIGSRNGTHAVVFTTVDGTTFTPNPISVEGALSGAFGLGIAFGNGNTFWGKATDKPLTLNSFDLGAQTGAVIKTNILAGVISAIGVSSTLSNLAGISIETPDNLQLYDMVDNTAYFVATNAFPQDNPNANLTGAVDFAPDKVFALDTGNGLMAMSFTPRPPPPFIVNQPQDRLVGLSSNAAFSVSAAGVSLSYQWIFQASPIPGATASAYTRTNAQLSHQGAYAVVITNLYGAVTSSPAMLTVVPPPTIGVQPQSRTNAQGTTAVFEVAPGGEDTSINYQWLFNGAPITNATQPLHSVNNVQSSHAGQYRAVLSNPGGAVTSQVASLTVVQAPQITTHPQSRTNQAGTEALFSVSASGTGLGYQWLFNEGPISGATLATYSKPGVVNTDAGNYRVIVSNSGGAVTSLIANLVVAYSGPPAITSVIPAPGDKIELQFSGGPGQFILEASPNLTTWSNRATLTPSTGTFSHEESTTEGARLFYRIKRDP